MRKRWIVLAALLVSSLAQAQSVGGGSGTGLDERVGIAAGGGANFAWAQNYTNPAGTASATSVQMGVGLSFTPLSTGTVLLIASGVVQTTVASGGGSYQLSYGTGTAPANGAAAAGTSPGNFQTIILAAAAEKNSFSVQAVVSGLTPGTTYWVDLQLKASGGGTTTLSNVTTTAAEL